MHPQPLSVAREYHQAWTTRQFDQAGALLAENILVEVPVNSYADRAQFMSAVSTFGSMATDVRLLAEFGTPTDALLLYDIDVAGLGPMRVAEHFTVTEGRVTRLRQVHDTAALRAAGFVGEGA
jgi:SnoaL-like protein